MYVICYLVFKTRVDRESTCFLIQQPLTEITSLPRYVLAWHVKPNFTLSRRCPPPLLNPRQPCQGGRRLSSVSVQLRSIPSDRRVLSVTCLGRHSNLGQGFYHPTLSSQVRLIPLSHISNSPFCFFVILYIKQKIIKTEFKNKNLKNK